MPSRPIYLMLMLSTTLLIGCANGVRPYDGVVGFTPIPQQPNYYRYVDELRKGQTFVVAELRKGCAEHLKIQVEHVQLEQIEVKAMTGRVSQQLQIPTGVTWSGDNFQTDRYPVYGQDHDSRAIALIEATAHCHKNNVATLSTP